MCIFFYFLIRYLAAIQIEKVCSSTGADLGGGCRGCAPSPPEMTCGFLIQLVFCKKIKKTCGLLVLSKRRVHPLLKKNPGSTPAPWAQSKCFGLLYGKWPLISPPPVTDLSTCKQKIHPIIPVSSPLACTEMNLIYMYYGILKPN